MTLPTQVGTQNSYLWTQIGWMCVLKQMYCESAAYIILSMAGSETTVNKLIWNSAKLFWCKIGEARRQSRMKTLTFLNWLLSRSPKHEQILPRDLGALRRFCNVDVLPCKGVNVWYHDLIIASASQDRGLRRWTSSFRSTLRPCMKEVQKCLWTRDSMKHQTE